MSIECDYCSSNYVNYVGYCLSCHKQQPKKKGPTRRRLTLEERKKLIKDIQRKKLRLFEIAKKYNVDHKTVSYWRNKL